MGTIMALGVVATLVNMFGAVHDGKSTSEAIMGGFIVTTVMLLTAQTKAKPIGTLLMVAFLITSLSVNGAPLFNVVTTTVQGKNKGMINNG